MVNPPAGRLREHPQARFAAPEQFFDLNAAVEHLKAEHGMMAEGHRQIALYRHGPMTVGLFLFERGGRVPDHSAEGVVMLQPLSGAIEVKTESRTHALKPGQVLMLAPGVKHDVVAHEPSRMLMTVALEEIHPHSPPPQEDSRWQR
jgi:quercetin dioxygenase-like cupin family protein